MEKLDHLDKIRVKKIIKSISKELLSDQKDYRLIVYKIDKILNLNNFKIWI